MQMAVVIERSPESGRYIMSLRLEMREADVVEVGVETGIERRFSIFANPLTGNKHVFRILKRVGGTKRTIRRFYDFRHIAVGNDSCIDFVV